MSSHKNIIIALDEGTTNAKAVALDAAGKVIVKFNQPLSIQTPREGWVEQSGMALVEASVKVIAKRLRRSALKTWRRWLSVISARRR